jgi:dihydrofolate reductase
MWNLALAATQGPQPMTSRKSEPRAPDSEGESRTLAAQTFVSLDGVMQAPGGPGEDVDAGFRHGGWSMTYWDDVMEREMGRFMAQPHELLLGRKTYDIFAAYWPNHPEVEPGASVLNRATKYVASRTRKKLEWENANLLQGDVVAAVRELKRRPGPPIRVLGSSDLLQTLLRHDLVDEVDLWVFPVVLGGGKRLFDNGAIPTAWKLTRSQASGTGVLMHHYERAGDIAYGTAPGT